MENTFIKQTSLDYSLPYHIVEAIYKSGMMNGYSMKNQKNNYVKIIVKIFGNIKNFTYLCNLIAIMDMDLEIVYIKVPVLVKANRSNVEDVTNEIYGDGSFVSSVYHVEDNSMDNISSAFIQQKVLLNRINEQHPTK